MLPRVLALNDHFLDPGYNISAFHTIQINPGEKQQALHYGMRFPVGRTSLTNRQTTDTAGLVDHGLLWDRLS